MELTKSSRKKQHFNGIRMYRGSVSDSCLESIDACTTLSGHGGLASMQ